MRRIFGRAPTASLAVLGFHNLTPVPSQPTVSAEFPARFRTLCRLLARRYESVTVTEGVERLGRGEVGQRPLVAMIFDDGYADVHSVVLPILKAEGCVATSYVVVNSLETGALPWYEQLGRLVFQTTRTEFEFELDGSRRTLASLPAAPAERQPHYWNIVRTMKETFDADLPRRLDALSLEQGIAPSTAAAGTPTMLNTAQARELLAAGCEVGSHSLSHPILTRLDDAALEREIVGSRKRLSALLDRSVTSFCFPNGDNDARCVRLVESAGYTASVGMACGANLPATWDVYRLRRIPLSERPGRLWPWHSIYRIHTSLIEAAGV